MKILKHLLTKPLQEVPSKIVVLYLVLALAGFADAAYLSVEHYRNVIPPCTTAGCETVLTSAYATILGIPVSLLGGIFYLVLLIGTFMYLESRHGRGELHAHHHLILKWTMLLSFVGIAASAYFVSLQVFVIHALCQYCLISAFIDLLLLITGIYVLRMYKRGGDN